MIGLCIPKAKPSSKEKKENRSKQVIDLFNQEFRQREIAERFGIACSTVSAILKNNPGKIRTLSDQAQELLQSGKTSAEVSQELHCSIRTVERHRINPSTSSTSAYRKCDKNSKNTPNIYGLSFRGKGAPPRAAKTSLHLRQMEIGPPNKLLQKTTNILAPMAKLICMSLSSMATSHSVTTTPLPM